jgi:plasmid stabilization system protein ParE
VAEIVWRTRASRQLTEIHQYIDQKNPSAAAKYVSDLRQACLTLGEFPEKAPRYDDRYRGMVFRNHFVFYRYDRDSDQIYIVAILDGRRDVKAIFRGMGGDLEV